MTNRQTISCNSFDGVFNTFPNKAFCILSHCDTDEKMSLLDSMIEDIHLKFDLPIFIFSHLYLPQNIVDKVDYFVYNRNNPIYNLELITPKMYGFTLAVPYNNRMARRRMFYHAYAHYLQLYESITFLKNQKIDYGYIMNYDVPLSILTQINEYQKKLNDYDIVHFNYEEEDSMSTEVFFCEIEKTYEKIKDKLSIQNFETTNGVSLETVFKRLLTGLKFHNLGNFGETEGKAYIGTNNFDFYKKNDVTILHSNIDDLIVIPHSFDNALRKISLKNCESPRSKIKDIKFIFYDDNFIEYDIIGQQMKVNDIFHCDVKREYRYTKMCIDNTHEIMFDLNDENNYGFLE